MHSPPISVRSSSQNQSSTLNISSGNASDAPMPAAPNTDMDESMNNTSAIRSTAIEQITIHSSGSEMRVSDISIQSEFTGRRVGSDENEPDRAMHIDPSPRRDRADFVDNLSPH